MKSQELPKPRKSLLPDIIGIGVILLAAAAFLAGRMFGRGIGPRSESGVLGNGQVFVSMSNITPAP